MSQAEHRIGRWQVRGLIGAGGFGTVYLGVDPVTGERAAIKVVGRADQRARNAVEAEVAAMKRVTSPSCVRVLQVLSQPDAMAIVTELVEGASLRAVLREHGRLSGPQALRLLRGALSGLAAVHAAGLVHGDIKPDNILIDQTGAARIIDFGLATPVGAAAVGEQVTGSPSYLAPERIQGRPADIRSDIYAMSVLLFELLAGQRPYPAKTSAEMLQQQLHAPVPDLRSVRPDVGDALAQLCFAGMQKDPGQRPPTAEVFAAALDAAARERYGPAWLAAPAGASLGGVISAMVAGGSSVPGVLSAGGLAGAGAAGTAAAGAGIGGSAGGVGAGVAGSGAGASGGLAGAGGVAGAGTAAGGAAGAMGVAGAVGAAAGGTALGLGGAAGTGGQVAAAGSGAGGGMAASNGDAALGGGAGGGDAGGAGGGGAGGVGAVGAAGGAAGAGVKAAAGGVRSVRRVVTGIGHSGPALTAVGIVAVVVIAAVVIAVTRRSDAPRATAASAAASSSGQPSGQQQTGNQPGTGTGRTAPAVPPGSGSTGADSAGSTDAGSGLPATSGPDSVGQSGSGAATATGSSGTGKATDTAAAARTSSATGTRAATPSAKPVRASDYQSNGRYVFTVPALTTYCVVTPNSMVQCSVAEPGYGVESDSIPTAASCDRGIAGSPMIDAKGVLQLGCGDGAAPQPTPLPDNSVLRAGRFSCVTGTATLRCTADASRRGFTLSRTKLAAYPATSKAAADNAKTQVIEVDPLAAAGKLKPGYQVAPAQIGVGCFASKVSTSRSIFECGASADDAPACWPKDAGTVWCMSDPTSKKIRESSVTEFAAAGNPQGTLTDVPASKGEWPWQVQLADGTVCSIRLGGSWGQQADGYIGAYSCNKDRKILLVGATKNASPFDRSKPVWVGKLSPFRTSAANPPVTDVKVAKAWFASNAHPGIPKAKSPSSSTVPANADATTIANAAGCTSIRPFDITEGDATAADFLKEFGVQPSVKCTVQGQEIVVLVIDKLPEYCQALVMLSGMNNEDLSGARVVAADRWMIATNTSNATLPESLATMLVAKTGGSLTTIGQVAAG
ncbi:serine/threonine-protein kinase [Nakamurella aerolata]|uniref:Serine/threonine protein kinase n=1 Tax=Nakamurella aerolata TaxID=1656892 RepID=A0A849AI53_9ACTN|nr:serine/threonine-protein kinase [Nakamurella aerolata]NNG36502.1 serine/threonine protein kinase [Nakamurella aerolata]